MKKIFTLLVFCLICYPAQAKRLHYEKFYQQKWCSARNGVQEFVLPDKTRVDCLLPEYAVEIGFIDKKYQDIGQALYYAIQTNRKPAIATIIEGDNYKNQKYLNILKTVCEKYKIKLFIIKP